MKKHSKLVGALEVIGLNREMIFARVSIHVAIDFGFDDDSASDQTETGQKLSLSGASECPDGTVWTGHLCEGPIYFDYDFITVCYCMSIYRTVLYIL